MMLPLFISDVPLNCINEAAYEYHVPAKLIISVLNIERGKIGQAVRNKNGTYDLGPMQINTSWWPKLYAYRVTPQQVLYDGCTNVKVGTWILGKEIAEGGNLYNGIGNYHSHTVNFNQSYTDKVRFRYTVLSKFLI
jgi:soluble lytic murein transglycosylase-like protein